MRGTVRPMLKQLGMCEVGPAGRTDFTWTRPWMELGAFFRPKQISPGAIVNSVGARRDGRGVGGGGTQIRRRRDGTEIDCGGPDTNSRGANINSARSSLPARRDLQASPPARPFVRLHSTAGSHPSLPFPSPAAHARVAQASRRPLPPSGIVFSSSCQRSPPPLCIVLSWAGAAGR
jgi:hypothetical protein